MAVVGGSRVRKGVSEAVGAAIAFSVISLAMLYILLNFFSTTSTLQQITPMPTDYTSERLVLFLAGDTLSVKNVGSIPSYISYLVVLDGYRNKILVNAELGNICDISPSRALAPGDTASISCRNYRAIAVVTKNGRVFTADPHFYALAIEKSVAIPISTVYGGVMLKTTSELLKFLEDPRIMVSGAIEASSALSLRINTSGSISGTLDSSLVIVGRNPASGRLNILVVGRGTSGSSINIAGSSIDLSRIAGLRYRLKIENFTGTVGLGLGIHPCYVNTGGMCRISLSGSADRILLYNASRNTPGTIGLDPYIFVGDIDDNGNVEVVFVTQDFSTGSSSSVNDRLTITSIGTVNYIDSSATPIRVVFSGVPIDSRRYSSAILSVRMFFWDNSEDDISDNDNRIVMRVGLYDADTKQFVYSTYLSYYELSRYRHVKPFSTSYIAKDFTIYIPNTGKRYYIAIEFLDPFYLEGNRNDADLIIGLEYVGIALAGRW